MHQQIRSNGQPIDRAQLKPQSLKLDSWNFLIVLIRLKFKLILITLMNYETNRGLKEVTIQD
jgi:hypothetical protein